MKMASRRGRSGCDQRELPDTFRLPWPRHTSQGAPRAPWPTVGCDTPSGGHWDGCRGLVRRPWAEASYRTSGKRGRCL